MLDKVRGNSEEQKREGKEERGFLESFRVALRHSSCSGPLCGPLRLPSGHTFPPTVRPQLTGVSGLVDWNHRPVAALPPTGGRETCRIQRGVHADERAVSENTHTHNTCVSAHTHTCTPPTRARWPHEAAATAVGSPVATSTDALDFSVQGLMRL